MLGEGGELSAMDLRRLSTEIEQLYFSDYASAWQEAIGHVALQLFNDPGQGAEQLAGLTSAHSPLLQLLQQVREHTRFAVLADSPGEIGVDEKSGVASQALAAVAGKVKTAVTTTLASTGKQLMQQRFAPLHRLLDDSLAPGADLTQALQALGELQVQLASLGRDSQAGQGAFDMAKKRMGGQQDAMGSVRNAAARLPAPLNGWLNTLVDDSWRVVLDDAYSHLNQRYQRELYSFYSTAIAKRYPFNAHGSSDVALNDFREFFKPQGIAERFLETYLKPFVSGDPGGYRLRSIDGRSLPMSRAYLDQMATAQVIRQGFFAESQSEPQVRFKLEPYTMDPTVSRAVLRFGDQELEYRHGPIVPMALKWPTDSEDGRTSLVVEKGVGRPVGIEKNTGPWSLFRLFDLMQGEYLSGRDVMVLKADLAGSRVNYLLTSQRAPNPFDLGRLRTFRMPEQL